MRFYFVATLFVFIGFLSDCASASIGLIGVNTQATAYAELNGVTQSDSSFSNSIVGGASAIAGVSISGQATVLAWVSIESNYFEEGGPFSLPGFGVDFLEPSFITLESLVFTPTMPVIPFSMASAQYSATFQVFRKRGFPRIGVPTHSVP